MRRRFEMVKTRHKKTLEEACANGKMDEPFKDICQFIASTPDYFTSSCCSGRILLLGLLDETKKNAYFHAKWHGTVTFEELWTQLNRKAKGVLWFKMEPFILHVGCETLEHAREVIALKNQAGVKRGGIIVAEQGKFIVELAGTSVMALPVKRDNELLATEAYMRQVLEEANAKLARNYERLEKFGDIVREAWGEEK